MNTITGNKATQASVALTSRQRELLNYFDKMTQSAQEFVVDVAAHNARVLPRQRPQLRVVAGGSA